MSTSNRRRLHINSLEAFYEGQEKLFDKREKEVLSALRRKGPMTDREVMFELCFEEPNAVRPRITTLIDDNVLEQVGKKKDAITGKTVRIVRIRANPFRPQPASKQMELQEAL